MICLDTYVLVEIFRGNAKFADLLTKEFVITDHTLAEFYTVLYREQGEPTAKYWLSKFTFYAKSVSRDTLIRALVYRMDHSRENLSVFDCVGYLYAQEHKMMFVTGDKAFKDKDGVLFITK